jgi:hypothetical protein
MMRVEIGEDFVTIHDNEGELIHWVEDEWVEDSTLVVSIANAVLLAVTKPWELYEILGE